MSLRKARSSLLCVRCLLFVHMADKKLTSSASSAAPAPAASSSASVANPARAAVAEAKLDMSLGNECISEFLLKLRSLHRA